MHTMKVNHVQISVNLSSRFVNDYGICSVTNFDLGYEAVLGIYGTGSTKDDGMVQNGTMLPDSVFSQKYTPPGTS